MPATGSSKIHQHAADFAVILISLKSNHYSEDRQQRPFSPEANYESRWKIQRGQTQFEKDYTLKTI